MEKSEVLDQLGGLPRIVRIDVKSPRRIYLEIAAEDLEAVCEFAFRRLGTRFCTASAVDGLREIEILYHFLCEETNQMLSFRVRLDRRKPVVRSLTTVFPAADFIEREIHELFGVDFTGHPGLHKLLLSDRWPDGVFPLRKDYVEWDRRAVRDRGVE